VQPQAGATEVPILIDGDLGTSKDADGRNPVTETFRNLLHAFSGFDAEAFASEVRIPEETRSAPSITIPVVAVLGARAPGGPGKGNCNKDQPKQSIREFHDAPPGDRIYLDLTRISLSRQGKNRGRHSLRYARLVSSK